MAAGKSTRMKSRLPKAVHRMCGRPMARHIIESCREAGVERVHILDGRVDGALLKEIFSNLGSGTMVYSNRYSGIRPMRRKETSDVLRVMKPFVEWGILLPRPAETLAECPGDFIGFDVRDLITVDTVETSVTGTTLNVTSGVTSANRRIASVRTTLLDSANQVLGSPVTTSVGAVELDEYVVPPVPTNVRVSDRP